MPKLMLFVILFILFCIPAKESYANPDVTSGKCGEDVYWNYDEDCQIQLPFCNCQMLEKMLHLNQ